MYNQQNNMPHQMSMGGNMQQGMGGMGMAPQQAMGPNMQGMGGMGGPNMGMRHQMQGIEFVSSIFLLCF